MLVSAMSFLDITGQCKLNRVSLLFADLHHASRLTSPGAVNKITHLDITVYLHAVRPIMEHPVGAIRLLNGS